MYSQLSREWTSSAESWGQGQGEIRPSPPTSLGAESCVLPKRQTLKMPQVLMHNGRNKCFQPLETHFFGLVLSLAQSRLRRGGRLGRGMELGAWTWGAEGKVESISPGEVKEPGLLRPSPTPPTTQAKTMEPVPSLPDAGGRARHQLAPLQLCQPPPSPGPCVPGSPVLLEQPLPLQHPVQGKIN